MQAFDQALAAQKSGRLKEAEDLYRKIIAHDSRNFDAFHMLGIVCFENGKASEAERFFLSAQSIDSTFPPLFHNYGLFLAKLKRYRESIEQFDKALKLFSKSAPVYCDRGISLMELGRLDESLASHNIAANLAPDIPVVFYNRGNTLFKKGSYSSALQDYNKAIMLHSNYADAYCGRGNVFQKFKSYDEALTAYDKALALMPSLAEAWLGRGNVFTELRRYDNAIAAFKKALTFKPDFAEAWLGRGNVFTELKRHEDAIAAYDTALTFRPDLAAAWLGRGNVFTELKRHDDARAAYDEALALKPDLAEAWFGRGNVFTELKRHDDAIAAYDRALAFKPDLAEAWRNRGTVFLDLSRYGDALAAYDKAFALKPDLSNLAGDRLISKLFLCDWADLEVEAAQILAMVRERKPSTSPFPMLAIPSSAADQLQCATTYVQDQPTFPQIWRGEVYSHDRIRVAYLSGDFREHPVAHLTVGLFEHHDRSRFEVTGISFEPAQKSAMRPRITNAFEHFVGVEGKSSAEIADLVRRLEVDIAVDLMGHTQNARLGVFAQRPAPIQVSYLGYPGTTGASYIDYILADQTIIPEDHEAFYSEKVVWLPESYQVKDNRTPISDHTPTRRECGLPEKAFVFCSFNNSYKITPEMFDIWMRLLKEVDGSVLWLKDHDGLASHNLRLEAERRGVAPERLVFAPTVPLVANHLARYRQANLFLDTLPYNAHTTASDALWSGVPVLTCLGATFAGRVAASVLKSVGLDELATGSLEAYEALALKLARDASYLASVKEKLAHNRQTFPLFDTERVTRQIESAYIVMWQRYQSGEMPSPIR